MTHLDTAAGVVDLVEAGIGAAPQDSVWWLLTLALCLCPVTLLTRSTDCLLAGGVDAAGLLVTLVGIAQGMLALFELGVDICHTKTGQALKRNAYILYIYIYIYMTKQMKF